MRMCPITSSRISHAVGGCWKISKDSLLVQFNYSSYDEFTQSVGEYLRTKRFNLDIRKYLLGEAG